MPRCETTGYDVPSADAVDHPPHYNSHPAGVECITITEHMTFNAGNAVKYLWRAGLKGLPEVNHVEDLKKARWYIDREIGRMQKQLSEKAQQPRPILWFW